MDALNTHGFINGFVHVIGCQGGHAHTCQRFHLDACVGAGRDGATDENGVDGEFKVEVNVIEQTRMAEKNQVRGSFCPLDRANFLKR